MLRLHKGFNFDENQIFGDKSITHRAFILASIANGQSKIKNASLCADTLSTMHCLQTLGAKFDILSDQTVVVSPISTPKNNVSLHCGNSGTTARLLAGVVAGLNINAKFFGDQSLSSRPFDRIITPLSKMGANIKYSDGCLFEIRQTTNPLVGIDFSPPVASAQVKSAVLLCGLFAQGKTTVHETTKTRNHTENLLMHTGCKIDICENSTTVQKSTPNAFEIDIPNDFSTAAYFVALGLLTKGITIKNVGINPTRIGAIKVLKNSGAKIDFQNIRTRFFEEIADIVVHKSHLQPLQANISDVPTLIDEVPMLTLLASGIKGKSRFCGVQELKKKESDRMHACTKIAQWLGQKASILGKDIEIEGDGKVKLFDGVCDTFFDHRIAMTLCIAAATYGSLTLSDANCISVSAPNFFEILGAKVHKFALVGSDIKNSLSPKLYQHLADITQQNISYTLCQLPENSTDDALMQVFMSHDGTNVTMPFKQQAAKLLNAATQSINTVFCSSADTSCCSTQSKNDVSSNSTATSSHAAHSSSHQLSACSTDGIGLIAALNHYGISPSQKNILVVGAGGTAHIAVQTLLQHGAKVNVTNRTPHKAKLLEKHFEINYTLKNFDGIVSCIPPCPFENQIDINGAKFVFSAVYKQPSNLLVRAKQKGILAINGLSMLYFQAAKSLEIWTGKHLQTDFEKFEKNLEQQGIEKRGKMKILILNGANLNMLGKRNPAHYGTLSLQQLNDEIQNFAAQKNIQTEFFQTNSEGKIIDILQQTDADAVVLNAGAYTHYSYAIRDCIECMPVPVVDVHLSDINNREDFRKTNVLSPVTAATFCGKGKNSYFEAIEFLSNYQKS